jgi:hypothetical protein
VHFRFDRSPEGIILLDNVGFWQPPSVTPHAATPLTEDAPRNTQPVLTPPDTSPDMAASENKFPTPPARRNGR